MSDIFGEDIEAAKSVFHFIQNHGKSGEPFCVHDMECMVGSPDSVRVRLSDCTPFFIERNADGHLLLSYAKEGWARRAYYLVAAQVLEELVQ